jgi:hypothetical protein
MQAVARLNARSLSRDLPGIISPVFELRTGLFHRGGETAIMSVSGALSGFPNPSSHPPGNTL